MKGLAATDLAPHQAAHQGVGTRSRVGSEGGLSGTLYRFWKSFRKLKLRGSPASLQISSTSVCPISFSSISYTHPNMIEEQEFRKVIKPENGSGQLCGQLHSSMWQAWRRTCRTRAKALLQTPYARWRPRPPLSYMLSLHSIRNDKDANVIVNNSEYIPPTSPVGFGWLILLRDCPESLTKDASQVLPW